jgi:hypothetical protein
MFDYPLVVKTYTSENDTWAETTFETKADLAHYVRSCVKIPGQYQLRGTSKWIEQYTRWKKTGSYTSAMANSHQWKRYWEGERDKVKKGVIIDGWYIPGFYYFYLNYMEIFVKEERKPLAPSVWDSDYHFMLYMTRCILEGKHAVVVKTRQRGYSYKIMAILYWSYCWFDSSINTLGASDKFYVEKTWAYVEMFRNFVNTKTPWLRGPQVPKALEWAERKLDENGNYVGNNALLKGISFQQSPTKGVGGYQSFFFYEESGVAPTLLETVEYMLPALRAGDEATGTIIVSGSVGDLEDCKDLKSLFGDPERYGFLGVDNIWDEKPDRQTCGFFVPHSWSLSGYMDEDGNSLITKAENSIKAERTKDKESLAPEKYQLRVSQNPLTPQEAFAFRKNSYFPQWLVSKQQERLTVDKPHAKAVELFEDGEGKIKFKLADQYTPIPITTWPLKEGADKRGCVVIYEFPEDDPNGLMYFGGVDPIATDQTTTSESLFSITIFKNLVETQYEDEDGNVKVKVSGFRMVAQYVGRMEDIPSTNRIGEFLIRYYNARANVESNVPNFINHMQARNFQKHMFTKQEIGFLEDMKFNMNVHKQYGTHMTPNVKSYILQNIKDYITEEIDHIRKPDGQIVKTIYGVERIPDMGLLEELKQYRDGVNTDRLISFGLALSSAKHYAVNGVLVRKDDRKTKQEVILPPPRSFFKSFDSFLNPIPSAGRSYFKRLR